MSGLEHKDSDPWMNKEAGCQTEGEVKVTEGGAESGGPEQGVDKADVSTGRGRDEQISDPWRRERKVVVAVDGSDQSDKALDFYLDNMHKMEYEVVLVHCADMPRIPFCDEIPQEEWNTKLKNNAKSVKLMEEDYKAKLRNEGVNFKTIFFYHPKPGCGILQTAEDEGAAFIITGSRGLGRMRRTILGSVSEYVIHHSRVPVVICPPEKVQYRYASDSRSDVMESRTELEEIEELDDAPGRPLNAGISTEYEAQS